jgi:hypothetical protein
MGRPPLGKRAKTERQRRWRERKRLGLVGSRAGQCRRMIGLNVIVNHKLLTGGTYKGPDFVGAHYEAEQFNDGRHLGQWHFFAGFVR